MARNTENILPFNIDAEKALLGSILIDPEACVLVSDIVQAADFYRDAHRVIYQAILNLLDRQNPPDYLMICDELERTNKLNEVGGASYITSLVGEVPTSGNVEYYGHIIEDTAIRRRLIQAAGEIAVSGQRDTAEEALANAEEAVFAISQRRNRSSYSLIAATMSRCMERLDSAKLDRASLVGVPSGFSDLDKLTKGF